MIYIVCNIYTLRQVSCIIPFPVIIYLYIYIYIYNNVRTQPVCGSQLDVLQNAQFTRVIVF